MPPDLSIIVDAHQDIAYNAVSFGRDFRQSAYHKRRQEMNTSVVAENGSATCGLPEALLGRVGIIFGTLWTCPAYAKLSPSDPAYETPAQAYQLALDQYDVYQRLADNCEQIALVRSRADLESVLATWGEGYYLHTHKVGLVLSMEGADGIPEPKAFEEWYERGIRAVGLAWTETRYSGGTGRPGPLTKLGRELLEVMDSFHTILDLSHIAEEAFFEALDMYSGQIIASHSNPRRWRDSDRHLSDAMIRRLAEHDGVIGVVLYNVFLQTGWVKGDPKHKMPLDRVIGAIDHICQVTGSVRHVGIGSDFDGGFGRENIPAEMDTIADLNLIGTRLAARGYSAEDVNAVMSGNFLRVLRTSLPS